MKCVRISFLSLFLLMVCIGIFSSCTEQTMLSNSPHSNGAGVLTISPDVLSLEPGETSQVKFFMNNQKIALNDLSISSWGSSSFSVEFRKTNPTQKVDTLIASVTGIEKGEGGISASLRGDASCVDSCQIFVGSKGLKFDPKQVDYLLKQKMSSGDQVKFNIVTDVKNPKLKWTLNCGPDVATISVDGIISINPKLEYAKKVMVHVSYQNTLTSTNSAQQSFDLVKSSADYSKDVITFNEQSDLDAFIKGGYVFYHGKLDFGKNVSTLSSIENSPLKGASYINLTNSSVASLEGLKNIERVDSTFYPSAELKDFGGFGKISIRTIEFSDPKKHYALESFKGLDGHLYNLSRLICDTYLLSDPQLVTLDNLTNMEGLSGSASEKLNAINLFSNSLTTLNGLGYLPNLQYLWLRNCKLQNLDGLNATDKLVDLLFADCNSLENVNALKSIMTKMYYIEFDNCSKLKDISGLSSINGIQNIPSLALEWSKIVLYKNTSLKGSNIKSSLQAFCKKVHSQPLFFWSVMNNGNGSSEDNPTWSDMLK